MTANNFVWWLKGFVKARKLGPFQHITENAWQEVIQNLDKVTELTHPGLDSNAFPLNAELTGTLPGGKGYANSTLLTD
jgi:hypothetical protein